MSTLSTTVIDILIFVLDDDKVLLDVLQEEFKKVNITNVRFFTDYNKFYDQLVKEMQICVIDYWLQTDKTGMDVMKHVLQLNPYCLPIMMTSQSNPDVIIDLYDNGIFGYVRKDKPDFFSKLFSYIKRATDKINNDFGIFETIQEIHGNTKLLFQTCNKTVDGSVPINNSSS